MKAVIPSTGPRRPKMVLSTPMMSFGFLDVIFGGKGLDIDTYKPPKLYLMLSHIPSTGIDQSGPEEQN